jgi:aminopeptidase N
MKQFLFLLAFCASAFLSKAQFGGEPKDTSWKKVYRASSTRINDLVHTKLDVKFDYDKSYMYGKAWITLKPHFYTTDSLLLDAKGMGINEVSLMSGAVKKKLQFVNDGMQLNIKLDRSYKGGESYTIYIDYVSKPNELKVQGSAAITDAKGLYFINPKGEEEGKHIEIWTQGETEASSAWFPTIDRTNQKTTEEIYMTVPAKYVTLSNGLLVSQKKNADGTRTDYWKMDLPHAPYLFFMGVGDYAIIKDSYKGKEVSYYVEKEYAPVARKIFGNTPEMIKFYSDKLGVDYPWAKYSQIVGRDYVSGAMENTTATLHQDGAYQNARELTDGNNWESTIAHELFHQWFGDLVTAESWSNLTVNESFANYSETLWDEYKKGKDAGDAQNYGDMNGYLQSNSATKDLVRFKYADKEDMFDAVSYNKGGRILHMLRNYVGDDAFFKSLNNYLTTNKFKAGEAHQLRLAFEEVTGQDLNWYWNQWYFGAGHPKLKIDYSYDDAAGKALVTIEQTQTGDKIFKLPVAVDIYNGAVKKRYTVWAENKIDSFYFNYTQKPDLINVDGDKVLLCEKTDNKTAENFVHQWKYAPNYLDRREALDYFAKKNMKELAEGLKDKYAGLRRFTLTKLTASTTLKSDAAVITAVEQLANTEKDRRTKAEALKFLATFGSAKYLSLFEKNVNDSSYSVSAAALEGIAAIDGAKGVALAKKLSSDAKGALGGTITDVLISKSTEADFDYVAKMYGGAPPSQEKMDMTASFCNFLSKVNDMAKIKKGIAMVVEFRNQIPEQFRGFTDGPMKTSLDKISKAKGKEIEEYIGGVWK